MQDALSSTLLDLEDEGFGASQLFALYGAADELELVLSGALRDEVSIALLALLLREGKRGQIYFPLSSKSKTRLDSQWGPLPML
jgi:hypothetical protein